jgi:hypothetical protein
MVAAGCGGSSPDKPQTAAQYNTALLSICKRIQGDSAVQAAAKVAESGAGTEAQKFAKLMKLTTPEYTQFHAVMPPAGDVKAQTFNGDLASLISASETIQHDVSSNTTGAALVQGERGITTTVEKVAADFKNIGIGSCGTG